MIIESIKMSTPEKPVRHTIPAEQWEEMRRNGDARKYRVVSWEAGNTEIEVPKVDPVIQKVIEKGKTVNKPVRKKRTTKPKKVQ